MGFNSGFKGLITLFIVIEVQYFTYFTVLGVLVRGNLRERDHLKDLGVDTRIILKWIFKKQDGGMD